MNDTPVSRERMLECLNELERRGIEWEKEGMNEPGMRDSIYAIGEEWIRRTKERVEAIRTLISERPEADERVDLNELLFKCDHCGEILIPKVDENNDEEILIEPCDCILDETAPPDEGDRILRRLLWMNHNPDHIPILYGDDGEMQCNACVIDFLRDSPKKIQERIRQIAAERLLTKPPTERGEGDTCGFCNGPTRHITDGDWCTRCGTMNTDESITAPTDDELKPTPGTEWTHECDRCGAIAKNPALMCCAICDEGRMVKINGNG